MTKLPEAISSIERYCLVKSISAIAHGHLRVRTKLNYPDGSTIDLFVENDGRTLFEGFQLSDFGLTFATLDDFGVRPWKSPRRMDALVESLETLSVKIEGDRLVTRASSLEDLPVAVLKLGQACIQASCMIFTRRETKAIPFVRSVRSIIDKSNLSYFQNHEFIGPYGSLVRVDFRVIGKKINTSILSMSGSSSSSVHNQANEIFRRFTDLIDAKVVDKLLTVHDGQSKFQRSDDLKRLEKVSVVLPISDVNSIRNVLVEQVSP